MAIIPERTKKILLLWISLLLGCLCIAAAGLVTPVNAAASDGEIDEMVSRARTAAEQAGVGVATGSGSWTVAVYLCGSDLETKYGHGTNDLIEMLDADIPSNLNLIVITGGAGFEGWNPKGLKHDGYTEPIANEIWQITDDKMVRLYMDEYYLYMDRGDNAVDFFNFATSYAPAEHMMIEFWDHGGGPLNGAEYALDDYGKDRGYMSMDDIDAAVESANAYRSAKTGKNKFDIVGFDCCLMGSIEIAHAMSDSADYMVASEELGPGKGWNYMWLNCFGESDFRGMSSDEQSRYIGRRIIDTYPHPSPLSDISAGKTKWLEGNDNFSYETLALLDLSKTDKVVSGFSSFGSELRELYNNRNDGGKGEAAFIGLRRTAESVRYLEKGRIGQVDIYLMTKALADANISEGLTNACLALAAAVGEGTDPDGRGQLGEPANAASGTLVVYRGLAYDRAGGAGLAMFFPSNVNISSMLLDRISRSDSSGGEEGGYYDDLPITEVSDFGDFLSFIKGIADRSDEVKENVIAAVSGEKSLIYAELRDSSFSWEDFISVTADVSAVSDDADKPDYYLGSVMADMNYDLNRYEVPAESESTWITIDGTPFTAQSGYTHNDYYLPAIVDGNTGNHYSEGDPVPESDICSVHIAFYPDRNNTAYVVDWNDPVKNQTYDMLGAVDDDIFSFTPVRQLMNEDGTPGGYIANSEVSAEAGELEEGLTLLLIKGMDRQIPSSESGYKISYSFTAYDKDLTRYTSNRVTAGSNGTDTDGSDKGGTEQTIKAGEKFKSGGSTYKVISVTDRTAVLTKAKNAKTVTVPDTISYKAQGFRITGIASGAFKKSKAKKLVLKTARLSRKSVKGSLKKSGIKTVKLKIQGKKSVQKRYLKRYKKYFTKKNAGKKVSVKL